MPGMEIGSKAIVFGDFSFYWLIERGRVTLKTLHEKYAVNGVTGFIGTEFIDGRLVKREAVMVLVMA
jgi:HK97 family phage major capsid protein